MYCTYTYEVEAMEPICMYGVCTEYVICLLAPSRGSVTSHNANLSHVPLSAGAKMCWTDTGVQGPRRRHVYLMIQPQYPNTV